MAARAHSTALRRLTASTRSIAGLGGLDVLVNNAGFPVAASSDWLDIAPGHEVLDRCRSRSR